MQLKNINIELHVSQVRTPKMINVEGACWNLHMHICVTVSVLQAMCVKAQQNLALAQKTIMARRTFTGYYMNIVFLYEECLIQQQSKSNIKHHQKT